MNRDSWDIRFNQYLAHMRFSKLEKLPDCPDWFEERQFNTWQEEGLIVWNNIDKKIEALNGSYILRLLNQLESRDNWKTEGISVTKLVSEISLEIPPRGRRKKTEQKLSTESKNSKTYYKEMVHLPPEAGPELIELINKNKAVITNMAEREKKQFNDAMHQLIEWAMEFSRKEEVEKFDFNSRQFQWLSNTPNRWICQHLKTEGHVCVDGTKQFWCACTKRQRKMEKSEYFQEFSSAIEWAEAELIKLADEPEQPESSFPHDEESRKAILALLKHKLRESQFWIDPSVVEPSRISYKIFIEIEAAPTSFETITTRCGDTIRVKERFPGQSKLAMIINLDRDQFDFEQPLGDNSDWHLITSLTTFYQENAVADQSQKIWNQSKITQQFKEKNIRRARYGYQEVETGYKTYLGVCDNQDNPWRIPGTRDEHMERLALQQSRCYSLDVHDFRDFLGFSLEDSTDEHLLETMHETRARSKYIPEGAKIKRRIWLSQHESDWNQDSFSCNNPYSSDSPRF